MRFFTFIIALFYVISAYSQIPRTPFTGNHLTKVPNAASSVITIYNEYETTKEHKYNVVYKHDGNSVSYGNGYTDIVVDFNNSGQIVKYQELLYGILDEYAYDEKGRILENWNHASKKHYYYTETGTDSIVCWNYVASLGKWYKVSKEEIKYNDNGYKNLHYNFNNDTDTYEYWFTSEYVLDEQKNVIEEREIDRSQANKWTYTYTDKGYIYTVYQPASTPFCRREYIFNDKGDLKKEIYSEWMSNSYWFPVIITTYDYDYSTGITLVENEKETIKINGNFVRIETKEQGTIAVYSINGACIQKSFGPLKVRLEPGIYIAKIVDKSQKILIR